MKKDFKHITLSLILFFSVGFYTLKSDAALSAVSPTKVEQATVQQDTIPETRYPVSKTKPEQYEDLNKQSPADLRDPENIKTIIDYDLQTGMYIIRTKIGDMELGTPMSLTPEEYQDYSLQESIRTYYRQKNEENFRQETNGGFNIADMKFNIGPADKIFGPGGVRVKSQGSAEISLGLKSTSTKNPTLSESARNRTFFNFDNNVQLNMQAYVGTKINFNLNYNTQSSFDFDANRLKLAYTGEEDEIIKTLEAGNVSLNTSNSLIRGGAALFGIKTELQFGKLRVNALLAQQNSESQTVSTKGGAQTREFEISVDQYDEDRHFFLAYYFRDKYDKALAKLPYISSGIKITHIEVWITNKRSNYTQARDIVAFTDLAEHDSIHDSDIDKIGDEKLPYNRTNSLYQNLLDNHQDARSSSTVSSTLDGFLDSGTDYEQVDNARKLEPSEYIVNDQLGYISLSAKLQPQEVLAVAYKYTYGGKEYQVGEFANDDTENTTQGIYLKLLKGVAMNPSKPYWDLMMKNIYSLGAYSVQKDRFRLNILYQSDTTGTYINYLPDGNIANKLLLQVMNLDRLDANNEPYPNGIFDFVEGYTVTSSNGRIIFPVVEPFGSHLRDAFGRDNKYVYQELYDSTKTVAQQIAERNKFILRGEYRASSGSEIVLGATNIAKGSVVVTAGGNRLSENTDYVVDYVSGVVTILNDNIIASNTPINVSMENQSTFSMQRKTMMGLDLNYEFSKNFTAGATIMHMSEMPLTTKTAMGDESIKNTLWGTNVAYQGESQWLTNLVDKIPLVNLTKPSQISFNAEFAHLIAGHYESDLTGAYSYLDDFESAQSNFDLLRPYLWKLASIPAGRFEEAKWTNKIESGKNRALLAWYQIDGIFTRKSKSLPEYLRDNDVISDPYVRPVEYDELFPGKDNATNESSLLSVLNLAYYPNERGPYNLDADSVNTDGTLSNPEKRWGGMMRNIEQSDFELANIEYIEFWVMDPFIKNRETATGGSLYFNLGDISEDVLKDEKKFFENGLPVEGNKNQVDTTIWGKVPRQQSVADGFDLSSGTYAQQDVGLNGLSTEEEQGFHTYQDYLKKLQGKLNSDIWDSMMGPGSDKHSPRNDPSGDNFQYFRGSDLDEAEADILTRYKYFNGTEGNSAATEDSQEKYSTASNGDPDVEDINKDNTLNKDENYYEYEIKLHPDEMKVGSNFIVNKRVKPITLRNGTPDTATWYQFKIPIKDKSAYKTVGSIQDFKSIRFMRTYMTGFNEMTILRFGTFSLVRGEWRTYTQDLSGPNSVPSDGTLDMTTVNIEEDDDRKPVNYILPPGVSRMPDPSQSQIIQQNEQSLSLKVTNLGSKDARAIYKKTVYDMRKYKRMQLFVHAESLVDNPTSLSDGDLSVFIRLGSDYKSNYYEYEVPLKLTPEGQYSIDTQREMVWPESNMLDFKMEILTDLKTKRNKARRAGESGVNYNTVFSEYDPDNKQNTISVIGNPSLAEVKTIMIGIRNKSNNLKSGEVWVNELRMTDFDEDGGWAANGTLNVALSDLGTFNASGRIETAGFGGLDQSLSERSMDDYKQYAISTSIQLGKFFPEKAQVNLPVYYAYSKETTSPKYNPLDQDILLQEALDAVNTKAEKDSIKGFSQDQTTIKSLAINNVNVGIKSKTPMPYDPVNFSISYASSENKRSNPETEYETIKNNQGGITYNYSPYAKPFIPFNKLEKNNGYTKYIKQLSFYYLPSSISFQTTMTRNYYETQFNDLSDLNSGATNPIGASFSEAFYWDRGFNIRWNPINNLSLEFSSNTNARIETPHVQVNKKLEPDSFKIWKDAVLESIRDLGSPLAYDQVANITYNLPLQYIPVLDWINASGTYRATYNWERGSFIDQDVEIGNIITNQREINIQGNLNLQSLYNKSQFLKKVNQKFGSSSAEINQKARETAKRRKSIKYEGTIELSPDSGVIVTHSLNSKKLRVRARIESDTMKSYQVEFKVLDFARIRVLNRDTINIKLTVYPAPPPEENFFYKAAEYSSRFLMMIRRVNIQYSMSDGMMIPGFQPIIGDWLGQASGNAPGWGFALGEVRESYITDAKDKGWLITSEGESAENEFINPALINSSKTFTSSATLEPATGLKIDLNATRVDSRDTEIQFMFPETPSGMPTEYGGTFTMTTAAIGSVFSSIGNAKNGYASKPFDKFLENRNIIEARLQSQYDNINYNGDVQKVHTNSPDVLIPSFLAAYTGKDANKIKITAFPAITSLIPNWKISYDGLIKIPFIKQYFKSMILNHQYRCTYSVGGYSSNLSWIGVGAGNEIGFIPSNTVQDQLQPASIYEISSVNITESLSPIIGVDATFLNNVTAGAKIQRIRNLNLNMSSFQIIETHSNEVVVSLGYKYADFNKVLKIKKKGDFSNDLTLRLDHSRRKNQSLIRKIQDEYTQMTQGAIVKSFQFSADYAFSKAVTLRAFYELQVNEPLMSSASYPTSNSNYGISMRLSLTQ